MMRNTNTAVPIWDGAVRSCHWLLVLLIPVQWLLMEYGEAITNRYEDFDPMQWHARVGYSLLFIIVFRLLWGLAGTRTARFIEFVRSPATVISYIKTMRHGKSGSEKTIGHNPAGGWMVVVMLGMLVVQVTTGLFAADDETFNGPLYAYVSESVADALSELHEEGFNFLLALIALHISAIVYYRRFKQQNLLTPMINGGSTDEQHNTRASLPALLICVGIAALVTYVITRGHW